MLIVILLTVDGLPLMSSVFTLSCLNQSNERLSAMCWLIFCTFNTESLNL